MFFFFCFFFIVIYILVLFESVRCVEVGSTKLATVMYRLGTLQLQVFSVGTTASQLVVLVLYLCLILTFTFLAFLAIARRRCMVQLLCVVL